MLSSLALVVVIVIDQFRADELLRARPQLSPAGLGLLVDKGIFYDDAHHTQFFNATCPGHTAISTGAQPGLHGIMFNDDWDRQAQKSVYCVSDSSHKWLDADLDNKDSNIGTSAKRILTSTLGDEAKLLWGKENKVISISLKDRSAIALGGHAADGAFWFAPKSQKWTSSDAYFPTKDLPAWVKAFNNTHTPVPFKTENDFAMSERSITDVTDLALSAAKEEKLGKHPKPDILWISYSTHDYVGHATGDDSEALKKTLLSEDKNIARLISTLKKTLGSKKFIVALTADHGAGIDTDKASKLGIPGGKQNDKAVIEKLNQCLASEDLKPDAVKSLNVYLPRDTKDKEKAQTKVKECLERADQGIWYAITRDEILSNRYPQVPWLKYLADWYNPERGPDVVGVLRPYFNSHDDHPVTHETSYDYDTWVPLAVWWPGVRARKIHHRAHVTSLAPTLARILQTRRPSGATDDLLTEVMEAAEP